MGKKFKILLLPGDGIGPEVCKALKTVLNCVDKNISTGIDVDEDLIGGASFDEHKTPLSDNVLNKAKCSDAILLGSVGGDKYDKLPFELRPERGLLKIRKNLDLFANIRPARVFSALTNSSALKKNIVENMDIIVIRELTGGIYFGEPRGIEVLKDGSKKAINTEVYNTKEIIRLGKVGFEISNNRKKIVHSVEKANVMETGILWREEIKKLQEKNFKQISLHNMYADNCAMQMVRNPSQFDVIITSNLFGDILSDISAELTGSLGMLPSASLGENNENGFRLALYEPVHGSAPDIAGRNIANPIAMIASFAMLADMSMGLKKISENIYKAIEIVLENGYRTKDIMDNNTKEVNTIDMGELISKELENLIQA